MLSGNYLSQCWLSSLSPYGSTRPQCVNDRVFNTVFAPDIFVSYCHGITRTLCPITTYGSGHHVLLEAAKMCNTESDGVETHIRSILRFQDFMKPGGETSYCLSLNRGPEFTGTGFITTNRVCCPSGHYWNYNTGAPSYIQANISHLKIRHP